MNMCAFVFYEPRNRFGRYENKTISLFLCEKPHFKINILKYYVLSSGEVSSLKISSQNGLAW